jgi:hypothetical protein
LDYLRAVGRSSGVNSALKPVVTGDGKMRLKPAWQQPSNIICILLIDRYIELMMISAMRKRPVNKPLNRHFAAANETTTPRFNPLFYLLIDC